MNARRKLKSCAYSLLVIAVSLFCGGCLPIIQSITPNTGDQGTQDLEVTLTGTGFDDGTTVRPDVVIDGYYISGNPPPRPSPPPTGVAGYLTSWTDSTITLKLFINGPGDPYPAYLGAHTIVVETKYGFSDAATFYVTCPGCVPPPTLSSVAAQSANAGLVPGGSSVFLFIGTNLFNNNPQVQIDGSGVTPDTAPPVVQQIGCPNCLDYFYLPITAATIATPGLHNVWVTTAGGTSRVLTTGGGTSNVLSLSVNASTPVPSASPGATPQITRISPTHLCKCGGQVDIKVEGTGFGQALQPNIIFDNPNIGGVTTYPTHQANRDRVVVARVLIPDDIPDTSVAVRVQNQSDPPYATSDPYILILDQKAQTGVGSVVVRYAIGTSVELGGHGHLTIEDADNLPAGNPPPVFFYGIPGLRFGTPYWSPLGLEVDVDADGTPPPPITGDEATNLRIGSPAGAGYPFAFRVVPPP